MNYRTAMQEVYTTSQMARPSWPAGNYIFSGSFTQNVPHYDTDGTTVLYTLPENFTGTILNSSGTMSVYSPTDEDKAATDWDYWNPVQSEA